jgi:hypothetical protein
VLTIADSQPLQLPNASLSHANCVPIFVEGRCCKSFRRLKSVRPHRQTGGRPPKLSEAAGSTVSQRIFLRMIWSVHSSTTTAGPLRSCKVCGRALALGRPRNVSKQAMPTGTATSVNPMSHLLPPESTLVTASFGKVLHHAASACLVLTSLPATLGTFTSCCQQHEQAFGKTCNDTEPCVTHSLAAICRVVVPARAALNEQSHVLGVWRKITRIVNRRCQGKRTIREGD